MAAIQQPGNDPSTIAANRHYPRVLLIEDNSGDVELLSIAFEMSGMDALITTADDGDQGLASLRDLIAQGQPPDLVLLDLNMPRRSGFEVLVELAASPMSITCPVVVWTSSSSASDRERCLAYGVKAFFTKPERISDYITLVESLRGYLTGPRS